MNYLTVRTLSTVLSRDALFLILLCRIRPPSPEWLSNVTRNTRFLAAGVFCDSAKKDSRAASLGPFPDITMLRKQAYPKIKYHAHALNYDSHFAGEAPPFAAPPVLLMYLFGGPPMTSALLQVTVPRSNSGRYHLE